jgi:hypothetical protein
VSQPPPVRNSNKPPYGQSISGARWLYDVESVPAATTTLTTPFSISPAAIPAHRLLAARGSGGALPHGHDMEHHRSCHHPGHPSMPRNTSDPILETLPVNTPPPRPYPQVRRRGAVEGVKMYNIRRSNNF